MCKNRDMAKMLLLAPDMVEGNIDYLEVTACDKVARAKLDEILVILKSISDRLEGKARVEIG